MEDSGKGRDMRKSLQGYSHVAAGRASESRLPIIAEKVKASLGMVPEIERVLGKHHGKELQDVSKYSSMPSKLRIN